MNVRHATPFDMPKLLELLKQYRDVAPLPFMREIEDPYYISQVLMEVIAGRGVVLVAEEEHVCGFLLAPISPSFWEPSVLLMNEVAFWVNPSRRFSTAAHRLVMRYKREGEHLKSIGRIRHFFVSKMFHGPKYEKFGFSKLEEVWVI